MLKVFESKPAGTGLDVLYYNRVIRVRVTDSCLSDYLSIDLLLEEWDTLVAAIEKARKEGVC